MLNATSSVPSPSKCTKIVSGFAPDPTGGAYSTPQTPSWIKGGTSKGGEKEGGKGIGGKEGEGRYFGPSQCWKQIDATNQLCVEWDVNG